MGKGVHDLHHDACHFDCNRHRPRRGAGILHLLRNERRYVIINCCSGQIAFSKWALMVGLRKVTVTFNCH